MFGLRVPAVLASGLAGLRTIFVLSSKRSGRVNKAAARTHPSGQSDVRLGTAARCSIEQKGSAVLGIGRTLRRVHVLPGRGDQQAREIAADKRRTARLLRR